MSEIIDKISNAIEKLGRLTRVEVQENWTICDEECRLANLRRDEWENASRNEKGHIIWPKGREVLWFSQSIVVPEHLYNYPLTGLSLRLCLTWWAEDALIYVRDHVAHQGDLFDSSVRLLLSSSVQPGDQFWVSLRLVSPQHDIGALMHSSLIYEITEDKEEGRQDKEEGRRKKEEGRGKTVGVVPECLPQSPVPSPLSWGDPGFVADELALIKIFLSENSLLSPTENQETRGISLEDSKKSDESPQKSLTDISLSPSGDPETACREKKTVSTALVKETLRDRVVSCALDKINWDALPDSQEFTRSLIDFHKSLLPYINKDNLGKIYLIGHSHLDLAWLWPIRETWEVAKNTFTSVLHLQKDFPELLFCHTTPALYAWIEENQPDLFNSIKQQIDTGRWEVIGGLWVEPELNLISGESIARQILYGQRYSLEKFGKPMEIAWLPDTFGFCWQLPQLLKEGGIKFFVTQKLRWNDTTKFPHDIFWWESPDGSRILSLMSAPIGEGINPIKMTNYLGEWQRKTGLANALWLPGVGDHGGGPTRDMLEIAYRWEKSPFCPKFEFKKVGDYLHELSNFIYSLNLDSHNNETRAERDKSLYKERDDSTSSTSDVLSLGWETSIYKYEERDDSTFWASDSLSLSRDMSIYEKHDSTFLGNDSLSLSTEKDSTSLASDFLFSQGDTSIDKGEKDSTSLASDFLSLSTEKDSTSLRSDSLSLPRDTSIYEERDDSTSLTSDVLSLSTEKESTSLASDVLFSQGYTSIDKGEKDLTSLASNFLSSQLRKDSMPTDASIDEVRDDSISLTSDTLSLQSEISIDEERDDSTCLRSDVLSTRGISIHKTSGKNHVKGRQDAYPTVVFGEVDSREKNSTSLTSDTFSLGGETFLSDRESDSLTDTTIRENDEIRSRFFAHPTLTDNQDKENLPVWRDELYLEFHRGCYTTHAEQKYWNRYSEGLLYEAELFSTFASIFADFPYPKTALEIAWKQTLFNQFHDILPGTSIPEVYEEVNPTWQQVTEKGEEILKNAIASLASHLPLPTPPHLHAKPIIIFNSLNWIRSEVVSIPLPTTQKSYRVYNALGNETPTQFSYLHDNTHLLFLAPYIPSLGYRVFWLTPENPPQTEKCTENDNFIFSVAQENALGQENNFAGQEWVLENTALRVTIDEKTGNLTSLYDKANHRETLNENGGNLLQAFTDSGQYWDAWNIDPNYQDYPLPAPTLLSIQWIENGEIRQRIRVIRKIADSDFCQDYILDVASPLLRIETKVNWQETHVFVKAAFNFNLNVDFVNYEIASGAIARTTQPKTAQEKAKWEVSALRWADMSNHEYGVSLLNNCKYGYDATPNQLRLSLLRGSTWPDPNADQGFHHFAYGVYPHQGNWQDSKTVQQGYAFNLPLKVWLSSPQLPCFYGNPIDEPENQEKGEGKFLDLGDESLVLMALKQAEEQDNVWILRCYESEGKHSNLSLTPEGQWQILAEVDLLEKARSCFNVRITPWQIKTFAVTSKAL
jgi:alpha-mannosidase